jgi:hypothetical protein
LEALGIPVVAGRGFTPQEIRGSARVAIISESLAKELNLSPAVGARVQTEQDVWEVIGVARNASYARLTQPVPVLYVPLPKERRSATVTVRTAVSPQAMISAAREAIRSVDKNVPLVDVYTMEQQISRTLQRERMFAWLCGSFGVLALVLCVVGIYGLMSHATARRTAEIGIRIALGASGGQVVGEVVRDGMGLTVAGLVVGVPVAIWAAKFAQRQQMLSAGPLPYWTLAAALAVLIASSFVAVLGPALRAASLDPMRALRQG